MLSQEVIDRIANDYGLKAEDFKAKIVSENEESVELKEGQFYTTEQLESRDRNKYNEAKSAYEEMTVKDLKKKFEYDFEGKTFDKLFDHHDASLKGKYSKGVSERVTELEGDLKKSNELRTTLEQDLNTKLSEAINKNSKLNLTNRLLSNMPETTIDKKDVLTLFLSRHELSKDDSGNVYFSVDGKKLKDEKTQGYLDENTVFTNFVQSYIKKVPGRGGVNEFGVNGASNDKIQFIDNWESTNGKKISSPEGVNAFSKWRADQATT